MKPTTTDFVVCIPARYQSSRLPGKPLLKLNGKELILWAIESANKLPAKQIVVATDDQRIYDFVKRQGQAVVMTDRNHQTGTDRIAECAEIMNWHDELPVLNYQGDEPNIPLENVNAALQLFKQHPNLSIATLYQTIDQIDDLFDPNVVKLITDQNDHAIYFSRVPIPWSQQHFSKKIKTFPPNVEYKRHIGLYVYRVKFLKQFSHLQAHSLEQTESLEQLRALAHGHQIAVAKAPMPMPHGIDTQQDIANFEATQGKG